MDEVLDPVAGEVRRWLLDSWLLVSLTDQIQMVARRNKQTGRDAPLARTGIPKTIEVLVRVNPEVTSVFFPVPLACSGTFDTGTKASDARS